MCRELHTNVEDVGGVGVKLCLLRVRLSGEKQLCKQACVCV
jgi:hypothetical protein